MNVVVIVDSDRDTPTFVEISLNLIKVISIFVFISLENLNDRSSAISARLVCVEWRSAEQKGETENFFSWFHLSTGQSTAHMFAVCSLLLSDLVAQTWQRYIIDKLTTLTFHNRCVCSRESRLLPWSHAIDRERSNWLSLIIRWRLPGSFVPVLSSQYRENDIIIKHSTWYTFSSI